MEGREYDLDIDDSELDHIWQQNQMLKDCLRFATQEDNQVSIKEFFEDEINYKACLEAAPDIVYADDYLLMQEQEAFRQ